MTTRGGGGGGVNGSGTQACAACKYQRRKCAPDCLLAPYFPPDQQRQFLNAHKLFGVSNILKIIKNLDPMQRAEAMRSIVFQSDARARDPIGGCHRIIIELQKQIERDTMELELVLRHLAMYREQAHAQNQMQELDNVNHGQQQLMGLDMNSLTMGGYNPMMQQFTTTAYRYHHHQEVVPRVMPTPNRSYTMEGSSSSGARPLFNEFEDNKPQCDIFDDKQGFTIDDGDSFPCSSRNDLKEEQNSMEQVQEHDLKGAASLFTLTN